MLILILTVVGVLLFSLFTVYCCNRDSILIIPTATGLVIVGILLVILLLTIIINTVDMPGTVAEMQQTYKSLTYQLDNVDTLYGNSRANDIKELYDGIQEWNEKIAAGRIRHKNSWTNWLYPIDYEQFNFIELTN